MAKQITWESPFECLVFVSLTTGNLGDDYANWKRYELRFRAARAKQSLFNFLWQKVQQGTFDAFARNLKLGPNERMALESAVRIANNYQVLTRLTGHPYLSLGRGITQFYNNLISSPGFGPQSAFWFICELHRVWRYPMPPANVIKIPQVFTDRLRQLNLTPQMFTPEEWSYVDLALWHLFR